MQPLFKYSILLLLIEIFIMITGYFFVPAINTTINIPELTESSVVFMLIVFVALIIFFRGQKRGPDSQTMHSLVSVSIKFLLELFFAFIWFFIAKKSGLSSVLLFFVLYLTFTMFLIFVILKTLKHRPL